MNNNQSYETLINQLKQIIEDFQKGNMQLSQAVEKYNTCTKLIEQCTTMLDKASKITPVQTEVKIEDVKFEENMKHLEEMLLRLNNHKDISLEELTKISIESVQKTFECDLVLNNFHNMIEYTKQ